MDMEAENHTGVWEFILLGLSDDPQLQPLIFGLFLSMYLVMILGNLLIILAVSSDPHLHTPMYFFLSNLSFVEVCLTSTTVPKMLVNTQTHSKDISYRGCLTQVYFLMIFAGMDNFLLTVMAFDCFVAICHPLNYTDIMNPWLCVLLVLLSWLIMFWVSLLHILLLKQLTFSSGTAVPHLFCELSQLLKATSSDTLFNRLLILRVSSSVGKSKAFSTCGSHLCVVFLFYRTGLGVHLSSAMTHPSQGNMIASVMYTVVTPMLNPFFYSLRNKDVKAALGRRLSRVASCP
ncbi:Hypothetical predicted protein [Marmota monax]|uniref:G-protein coupled receptors family 1 profile domain-containing protein n=1 Tax=Marmota monax TaxID=9995 RepID=A0A5E4AXH5_MARMO|nr:Hypothetical predicted protein [Marmota monax]